MPALTDGPWSIVNRLLTAREGRTIYRSFCSYATREDAEAAVRELGGAHMYTVQDDSDELERLRLFGPRRPRPTTPTP